MRPLSTQLQAQAAEQRRHRENSARVATELFEWETQGGEGTLVRSQPWPFQVIFTRMPAIAYGAYIMGKPNLALLPMLSGGVYEWVTDSRTGAYIGAKLYVVVQLPQVEQLMTLQQLIRKPSLRIAHHFTFTGPAAKGAAGAGEVREAMEPRAVIPIGDASSAPRPPDVP